MLAMYQVGLQQNYMHQQQMIMLSQWQAMQELQFRYMTSQNDVRKCWNGICSKANQVERGDRESFKREAGRELMQNIAPSLIDFATTLLGTFSS